jgi:hypothetical protein
MQAPDAACGPDYGLPALPSTAVDAHGRMNRALAAPFDGIEKIVHPRWANPMSIMQSILMRTFGRPRGVLGGWAASSWRA